MRRKVIIDTDPGIDDAMAVHLALKSPQFDILGLTTIFGNAEVNQATTNALRLLELAGRTDIPVARGESKPLQGPFLGPASEVHGEDGQGNTWWPAPQTAPLEATAAEFLIEQTYLARGAVTLVAIGPLTNLALALDLEPDFAQRVEEVVLMGGNALGPGNATPAAEANIFSDPDAADLVLGADWPVTMIGLDVTHKVLVGKDTLARYATLEDPLARYIAEIVPHYLAFYWQTYKFRGIFVHDFTAIAYLLAPELFSTQSWPVRVDRSEGIGRGKTWPWLGNTDQLDTPALQPWKNRPLVKVCTDVRGDGVIELMMARLQA